MENNTEYKKYKIYSYFWHKCAGNWGKIDFLMNDVAIGHPYEKYEPWPNPHSLYNINSIYVTELNVK